MGASGCAGYTFTVGPGEYVDWLGNVHKTDDEMIKHKAEYLEMRKRVEKYGNIEDEYVNDPEIIEKFVDSTYSEGAENNG